MTDWSARSFCNVVYAYLMEDADAKDRIEIPTFLVAMGDAKELPQSNRDRIDEWLNAPPPREQAREAALLKYLRS